MSKSMELKVMMDKMNKLANAVHNAKDLGMKQIWTDKWYALVKQYAQQIKNDKAFQDNVKANERLND
jgi:hypothetical protein